MPRSPWTASAGCRNTAAVPVLHSVATMVRAMCPDLPIPVTTTLPGCARIRSTARISSPFNRPAARATDAASISMAARARASHSCLALVAGKGQYINAVIRAVQGLTPATAPISQHHIRSGLKPLKGGHSESVLAMGYDRLSPRALVLRRNSPDLIESRNTIQVRDLFFEPRHVLEVQVRTQRIIGNIGDRHRDPLVLVQIERLQRPQHPILVYGL